MRARRRGRGISLDGSLHHVDASLSVVEFDDMVKVELRMLDIDGEICEGKKLW